MADLTLLLGGDVMTGRGVDAVLPRPGPTDLREEAVRDAREYVRLVEAASGPVPRPAPPAWPWGDALALLDAVAPDVRIVNLETAVTGRGTHEPSKAIPLPRQAVHRLHRRGLRPGYRGQPQRLLPAHPA
ncbi:CapA family protein, partial [Micromonospora sp. NPDC049799]|uniref:CapA family protein n=1 Tax=Micromonospora sp. NPDC049799 TaxID=3154741 RepID=UPI0033ECE6BB